MPAWVSGTKTAIGCFSAGQLVTVLLSAQSGTESPSGGVPPCLRFEPETTTDLRSHPHAILTSDPNDQPYFLVDLAPFWLPYNGTLFLQGGGGNVGGGVTYNWTTRVTRPREIPAYGPRCLTLRQVSEVGLGPTSTPIPPGTAAISMPVDGQVRIVGANETTDLDAIAGQRLGISNWGAVGGTIQALSPTPAQAIYCEIWL